MRAGTQGTHPTNQQLCVGMHIANPCQQESEIRSMICKLMVRKNINEFIPQCSTHLKTCPRLTKILFLYISIKVFPDLAILFVNHEYHDVNPTILPFSRINYYKV
jgi:hypothetical protein